MCPDSLAVRPWLARTAPDLPKCLTVPAFTATLGDSHVVGLTTSLSKMKGKPFAAVTHVDHVGRIHRKCGNDKAEDCRMWLCNASDAGSLLFRAARLVAFYPSAGSEGTPRYRGSSYGLWNAGE